MNGNAIVKRADFLGKRQNLTFLEREEKERPFKEDFMARMSQFKRNYDKGEVTLPNGTVIDVKGLPEQSVNFFAVYGFIRACQDPFGGVDEPERTEKILEHAKQLVDGTLTKERRSTAKSPEDKLADLEEKLESQKGYLQNYINASDVEKRFAASQGINRTGYEKEITKIEKQIKKFKLDNNLN